MTNSTGADRVAGSSRLPENWFPAYWVHLNGPDVNELDYLLTKREGGKLYSLKRIEEHLTNASTGQQ